MPLYQFLAPRQACLALLLLIGCGTIGCGPTATQGGRGLYVAEAVRLEVGKAEELKAYLRALGAEKVELSLFEELAGLRLDVRYGAAGQFMALEREEAATQKLAQVVMRCTLDTAQQANLTIFWTQAAAPTRHYYFLREEIQVPNAPLL